MRLPGRGKSGGARIIYLNLEEHVIIVFFYVYTKAKTVARLLNVPKVTEISWEKGRRKPTGAALRLLDLVRKRPDVLQDV